MYIPDTFKHQSNPLVWHPYICMYTYMGNCTHPSQIYLCGIPPRDISESQHLRICVWRRCGGRVEGRGGKWVKRQTYLVFSKHLFDLEQNFSKFRCTSSTKTVSLSLTFSLSLQVSLYLFISLSLSRSVSIARVRSCFLYLCLSPMHTHTARL